MSEHLQLAVAGIALCLLSAAWIAMIVRTAFVRRVRELEQKKELLAEFQKRVCEQARLECAAFGHQPVRIQMGHHGPTNLWCRRCGERLRLEDDDDQA